MLKYIFKGVKKMKKQKEKVRLFEKVEITDPEYAQKLYDKEESKFKWKLICFGVALLGSIGGAICFGNVGANGFVYDLLGVLWLLGIAAVIAAGSFMSLIKIILKFGKIAYTIVPFILIDVVCFIFGAAFGFIVCMILPVIPCGMTLYQSYKNIKEAQNYLALWNHNAIQSDENEENII